MQRIIPDGSITGRSKVITEAGLAKRFAARHEPIRDWEERARQLAPPQSLHEAAYGSLEARVGHLLMAGEIDAAQALEMV